MSTDEDELKVAEAVESMRSSAFTAETQIGAITFEREAGYTYIVDCPPVVQVDDGECIVQVTLREDNAAGQVCMELRWVGLPGRPHALGYGSVWDGQPHWRYEYKATETGPKTFVVTAHRVSGKGTIRRGSTTDYPQRFRVYRFGPIWPPHDQETT